MNIVRSKKKIQTETQVTTGVNRKHEELSYGLAQFVGGNGCFSKYLEKFKLQKVDSCYYCNAINDAEHTFFDLPRQGT